MARLNRFDEGGRLQAAGAFDWIYERIATKLGERLTEVLGDAEQDTQTSGARRLADLVDFNLMHEFDSRHSRFDW